MTGSSTPTVLRREVGLPGAVLLGLGSILGTGVFVSIGLAVAATGRWALAAVAVAAGVALCNGLSSAQLAASHPVAGGTYAYGRRYLTPAIGFTAGWLFLLAKSASAATACLGAAGYILHTLGGDATGPMARPLAGAILVAVTVLVLAGLRRSNVANAILVSITLLALLVFVIAAWRAAPGDGPFDPVPFRPRAFAEATALLFVAYTGYGRVATLGEEIRAPRRNIPRAVVLTLVVSMAVYVAVTAAVVAVAPVDASAGPAPLAARASGIASPAVVRIVAVGAVTAMLGVLLNLLLGLSRVAFAMGRERDLPRRLARLDASGHTPVAAVLAVAVLVGIGVLVGDVGLTWSFSAFTVLVYYGITNLAALRLAPADRRFPRGVAVLGLVACLALSFAVEPRVWAAGLAIVALGLVGRLVLGGASRRAKADDSRQ